MEGSQSFQIDRIEALRRRTINKLENIKDISKLSDYETILAQKPKKPRVPRIRRPRIKIESKDILSANVLALKNKAGPQRKS